MKAKNLEQARQLIKRYESITLEEIKEAFTKISYPQTELTGFCNQEHCILCSCLLNPCNGCVYTVYKSNYKEDNRGCYYECGKNENKKTFNRIDSADTPRKLLNAYRARAKHIRKLIDYND